MLRALPVCALLLTAAPVAAQQKDPPGITVRVTVHPATTPRPALKYQLLPELREMSPGNPILGYLTCFSEQNSFFHGKEASDQRERWHDMPLKDLPVKELRGYGGVALRRADEAARLDLPDWQSLVKLKRDGFGLLVPEVQQMRVLISALRTRFRGEVADRRFDDALVTAKTMFALARHMNEHPSLIGHLVGVAFGHITIEPLDELIQQPGAPNLYWALTDLPSPFLDLHKGIQGFRVAFDREFAPLDETAPMSEAQLTKAVARVQALLDDAPGKGEKRNAKGWLAVRTKDEAHVRAARKRLVGFGLAESTMVGFPPLQVVLLDEKYAAVAARDDVMKTVTLPYWQGQVIAAALPKPQGDERLLGDLTPAMAKVRHAQARLEQRIALLRHVEALRQHLGETKGRLPKQLSDVKLPLPLDPVSGRPFLYSVEKGVATVSGAPLWDDWAVRYVVTVAK